MEMKFISNNLSNIPENSNFHQQYENLILNLNSYILIIKKKS